MWSTRGKQGFTLIELLVVIAIIALLMAILLPALGHVRRQARGVVCQAHLNQWGRILALYAEDNDGCFPCDLAGRSGIWFLRGAFLSRDDPNQPDDTLYHFRTQKIALCPMAASPGGTAGFSSSASFGSLSGHVRGTYGSTFGAWQIKEPGPLFRASYGYNRWFFGGFCVRFTLWHRPHSVDIFSLGGKANIPVLLDSARPWGRPRESDPPPSTELLGSFRGDPMQTFCVNRHNGHVNALFVDWSVRKIGLKELWTLKWYVDFNTAGRWTKAGGVQPEDWPEWMRTFRDY